MKIKKKCYEFVVLVCGGWKGVIRLSVYNISWSSIHGKVTPFKEKAFIENHSSTYYIIMCGYSTYQISLLNLLSILNL